MEAEKARAIAVALNEAQLAAETLTDLVDAEDATDEQYAEAGQAYADARGQLFEALEVGDPAAGIDQPEPAPDPVEPSGVDGTAGEPRAEGAESPEDAAAVGEPCDEGAAEAEPDVNEPA